MDSDANLPSLDLDTQQTRRFYVAGTVAFPSPFPSLGNISILEGSLLRLPDCEPEESEFVAIQEKSDLVNAVTRVVNLNSVAAVFFAGEWEDTSEGPKFCFSEKDYANDLEKGVWFLKPISAHEINSKLDIDVRVRNSAAKGIVFVPECKPVLTITENTQTATKAVEQCASIRRGEKYHFDFPPQTLRRCEWP